MERLEAPPTETARLPISVADRDAALRAANRPRSTLRLGWLWEWAKVFPAAVLLFFLMKTAVVEAYKIPSGSMESTLLVGDFLLVNKMVYGAEIPFSNRHLPAIRSPKRGDVIVFEWPTDPTKNFVKRLVGLPGDTVAMNGGNFLLNGVVQKERYVVHAQPGFDPTSIDFRWQRNHVVKEISAADSTGPMLGTYRPSRDNWGPLVVAPNSFFVLGDNRDNSLDSRYWGFVPDSLLRGTPLMVYYSYAPDSSVTAPWITRIRWSRLGGTVD
ncbi:MAG: signal peptidase I [Phycisphaerae bacterium]|nr:signal peptidase I [Gemmatimonadaceae bacterium]